MTTTDNVLDHHLDALLACDLDAIMEDYDDSAVLVTPDVTLRGLAALREFFRGVVTDLIQPGSQIEATTRVVDGEFAYIVWHGESQTHRFPFATDTFVVRHGKIVFQSFAGQVEPK
jgi:ketosteroid isomerase-like protein